jgi:hypothetical protein
MTLAIVAPETSTPDGFQVTVTGLQVNGKPTFEQWLEQGEYLWYAKQSIQFCIGDWVNYGEHAYGQKYSQAIDETRYTLQSLQNIAYTCAAIPPTARRENVPFSSHSEVASLPETERTMALDKLASKEWTRSDVRSYKRSLKTGDTDKRRKQAVTITPELVHTTDGRWMYAFPNNLPLWIFENPITVYVETRIPAPVQPVTVEAA